ncbi:hypothetical protein [Caballeronia sp. SL2Y3]|uniref:hypothetical protein n=1 Tax=Caballeronia sp. SL2Y3 TaxID=2878151 RepID=UPI001FD575E2|nr:hypothetical protein [Caballeronia sp. SL2Y3]
MLTAVVGSMGFGVWAFACCGKTTASAHIDEAATAIGASFVRRKLSKLMNGNVIRNQVREGEKRACAVPKFYHRAPERFGIYGKMPRSETRPIARRGAPRGFGRRPSDTAMLRRPRRFPTSQQTAQS